MSKRNKKRNNRPKQLTRQEYDLANGDLSKMPSIVNKHKEIETVKNANAAASAEEMLDGGVEVKGIFFYKPTMRHRSFMRTVAFKYLDDLGVLYNLAAYIRSVPSDKIDSFLYTQKLKGTLEVEAYKFVSEMDLLQVQLIADELLEGIVEVKEVDESSDEEDKDSDTEKKS